jgi:Tol biopolymer transport system component
MNLIAYKTLVVSLLALSVLALASCRREGQSAAPVVPPQAVSTPEPKPHIAYLRDGDLWLIQSDGANQRLATAAGEGEAIQDFVWGADGDRLYFSMGLQLFEFILPSGATASAGELAAPQGVSPISIDSLEMGRDGKTIIIRTLDAGASARLFAITIGERGGRELSVDEYNSMVKPRPPVIRSVGEMSVSPDGRMVLFKGVVGTGEELFVADIETGARVQVTNLSELSGFEESVETEGGRRVIGATWSPDSRHIIFNPMQSCSESGLCYGRLVIAPAWGGPQRQLSSEMMVDLPTEWLGERAPRRTRELSKDNCLLVYDDGSNIVVAGADGPPKTLGEGNHPKWSPAP